MRKLKIASANRPTIWSRYRLPSPVVAAWVFAWVITTLIPTAHADTGLLGTKRWREHSHGVSLLPPLGSRLISQTADDAITRIIG